MKKKQVQDLIVKGVITKQGKQGYWVKLKAVKEHATLIATRDNIVKFFKNGMKKFNHCEYSCTADKLSKLTAMNFKPNLLNQIRLYKKHHASHVVVSIVSNESRSYGTLNEKITRELLKLQPSRKTEYDAFVTLSDDRNIKFEIKGSRIWSDGEARWQHIILEYAWDIIIFTLLLPDGYVMWAVTKTQLLDLVSKKLVTKQGLQGYWVTLEVIKQYATEITSHKALLTLVTLMDQSEEDDNENEEVEMQPDQQDGQEQVRGKFSLMVFALLFLCLLYLFYMYISGLVTAFTAIIPITWSSSPNQLAGYQ